MEGVDKLNLQQLYYVKKIAEAKSINKASKALHISQPALTKQLKLLENELTVTLFERSKNGVRLTNEGNLFLDEVEKILNQVSSLKQQFLEHKEKVLHIGALPSIATYLLPAVIKKINDSGYKANVLVLNTSDEIECLLSEAKIDAGFGQDVEEKDYVYPILVEPYYVFVPDSNPLADHQTISLSELVNQNMILPSHPCDIRKAIDVYLNQQGIILENIVEIGQNDPILSLVKAGVGLAILPEIGINDLSKNIKAIPLRNKEFTRSISLLTHSKKLQRLISSCLCCHQK